MAIDQHQDKVISLLHFDGEVGGDLFPDSTGRIWSASGGVTISDEVSRFGGLSAHFDGTGFLQSESVIGAGDFTLETFIQPDAITGNNQTLFSQFSSGAAGRCGLDINSSGKVFFFINGVQSGNHTVLNTSTVPTNTLTHVALVRSSGYFNVYVNGIGATPVAVTGNPAAVNAMIGSLIADVEPYIGFMDEWRVTLHARYTGNFTPPIEPFEYYESYIAGTIQQDGVALQTQVRVYDSDSGELIGAVTSDANGGFEYVILGVHQAPVLVMATPSPGHRYLVHGPIDPVLRSL